MKKKENVISAVWDLTCDVSRAMVFFPKFGLLHGSASEWSGVVGRCSRGDVVKITKVVVSWYSTSLIIKLKFSLTKV